MQVHVHVLKKLKQLPRPSVVSSILQMKNINPLAPPAPPATSSFTQPVVTKIDICEMIYHWIMLKTSTNPRGSCREVLASVKQENEIPVKSNFNKPLLISSLREKVLSI